MKILSKYNNKLKYDVVFKNFIFVIIVASMGLLLLNVMTNNTDGRMQVIDNDGGTEYLATSVKIEDEIRLSNILNQIKGVGEVEVMITYNNTQNTSSMFYDSSEEVTKVKGVIVAAEGATNVIIKEQITNAIASVFNISAGNVKVFEKE